MAKKRQNEKRRYTRIIFNERNRVQAVVSLPGQQNSAKEVLASVLNMSEGGVQVSIERSSFQEMRPGGNVLLSYVSGVQHLKMLKNVPMQIIWIMDNKYLEHVLLGMSFAVLSEGQRGGLRSFVENRLALTEERTKEEPNN
ncbi:MAG: PilZ domain-containing protein [Candidatus Electrothrix sp. ATG1]|nr:PilZ domain-containing protein [Candidatus Electrothrix sp. ATG1]